MNRRKKIKGLTGDGKFCSVLKCLSKTYEALKWTPSTDKKKKRREGKGLII
jgi:hypothetical protein